MEDLNKTQLILLTLLISFVTSIATGIITVSLLQEAPTSVTQTINRVVERTIEKVVPEDVTGSPQPVVKETVVVKEEDLVVDAINKNVKSIIRIKDTALVDGVSQFYGIGFLVNKDGWVVTDRRENISLDTTYIATLYDGTSLPMKAMVIDENAGLAFFQIIKDNKTPITAEPAVFASDIKLGQTVIAIEGESKNAVAIGRVTSLSDSADSVNAIQTDILPKTKVYGGPLLNLNGEIVGIRTTKQSVAPAAETFTSLSVIKSSVESNVKK